MRFQVEGQVIPLDPGGSSLPQESHSLLPKVASLVYVSERVNCPDIEWVNLESAVAKPLGLLESAALLESKGVLAGGHPVTRVSGSETIENSGRCPQASVVIADMEVDIVSDPGGDNVVWMCLSDSLPTVRRTGELPVY